MTTVNYYDFMFGPGSSTWLTCRKCATVIHDTTRHDRLADLMERANNHVESGECEEYQ